MNRARKIRKRVCICACEGEATAAPSGEGVGEVPRVTSSEATGGRLAGLIDGKLSERDGIRRGNGVTARSFSFRLVGK